MEGQLVHPQRSLVHRPWGCSGVGVWGVRKVDGLRCGEWGGWEGWVGVFILKDPSFIAPERGVGRECSVRSVVGVWCLVFEVWDWGFGFGVWGLRFGVWGLGFGV